MEFTEDENYNIRGMTTLPNSLDSFSNLSDSRGGTRRGSNAPASYPGNRHGRFCHYTTSHIGNGTSSVSQGFTRNQQAQECDSISYLPENNASDHARQSDADPDCLMTTPAPSRSHSVAVQPDDICHCDAEPSTNNDRFSNDEITNKRTRQSCSRGALPSLSIMLNHPHHVNPQPSLHTPLQAPIIPSPADFSHTAPPPPPMQLPLPPRTSISAASDTTIQSAYSISEQRCYLFNTLYQICLDASTRYIRSQPSPSTQYSARPRRPYSRRYHPYAYRDRYREPLYNEDNSRTLMDNISVICTTVWKKARRDEMAPHRAEADAVLDMSDLYMWGELLATNMEEDFTNEASRPLVVSAASNMCAWLKDPEGCDSCKEVEEELRGITRLENQGQQEGDENEDRAIL